MADALLQKIAKKLHLADFSRHIFLCVGGSCASESVQQETWEFLKARLKELELVDVEGGVFRSKADCLRVCARGPVAVVYPEGTWYRECNKDNLEKIIQTHLIGGEIVEELLIARNPLDGGSPAPPANAG